MAINWYRRSASDLSPNLSGVTDPAERQRLMDQAAEEESKKNAQRAYEMYQSEVSGKTNAGMPRSLQVLGRDEAQRREMANNYGSSLDNVLTPDQRMMNATEAPAYRRKQPSLETTPQLFRDPAETRRVQPSIARQQTGTISQGQEASAFDKVRQFMQPFDAFGRAFDSMNPGSMLGNVAGEQLSGLWKSSQEREASRNKRLATEESLAQLNPKAHLAGKGLGLLGSMATIPGVGQTAAYGNAGIAGRTAMMGAEGAAFGGGMQALDNVNRGRPVGEGVAMNTALGAGIGGGLGALTTKFSSWLAARKLPANSQSVDEFIQETPELSSLLREGPGARSQKFLDELRTELLGGVDGKLVPGTPQRPPLFSSMDDVTQPQRLAQMADEFTSAAQKFNQASVYDDAFMRALNGVGGETPPPRVPSRDMQMPGGGNYSGMRDAGFVDDIQAFGRTPEAPPVAPSQPSGPRQLEAPIQGDSWQRPMGGARINTGNIESIPPARYLEAVREYADLPMGPDNDRFLMSLWDKLSEGEKRHVLKAKFGDIDFNSGARPAVVSSPDVNGSTPPAVAPDVSLDTGVRASQSISPEAPGAPNLLEQYQSIKPPDIPGNAEAGLKQKVAQMQEDAVNASIAGKVQEAGLKPKVSRVVSTQPELPMKGGTLDTTRMSAIDAAKAYDGLYDSGFKLMPTNLKLFGSDGKIQRLQGTGEGINYKWIDNFRNSEKLPDELRELIELNMPTRGVMPRGPKWDAAWKAVNDDWQGSYNKYTNMKGLLSDDDAALGMALQAKATLDGDFVTANNLIMDFAGKATEVGRTMSMFAEFKKLSAMGWVDMANKNIAKASEIVNGKGLKVPRGMSSEDTEAVIELSKRYRALTEEQQVLREGQKIVGFYDAIIQKYIDPGVGDMFRSVQRTNLLLNSLSMVRNVAGNVSQMPANFVSQSMAATADALMTAIAKRSKFAASRGLSAQRRTFMPGTKNIVQAPRAAFETIEAPLKYMYASGKRGVQAIAGKTPTAEFKPRDAQTSFGKAMNDLFEDRALGIDTSPSGAKFEQGTMADDVWRNWREAETSGFIPKSVNDVLGRAKQVAGGAYSFGDDLTKTGLRMGDRPFYQIHFDSIVEGYQKHAWKNIPKSERVGKWSDLEVPMNVLERARDAALEGTFQNKSVTADLMIKFRDLMNTAGFITSSGKKFGVGSIAMPFTLTPANIMQRILDHNIAGVYKTGKQILNFSFKNGKFDQRSFTKAASESLTGAGILALGVLWYKNGWATGKINPDKDARLHAQQNLGVEPYSLNVSKDGKTWVAFDWAQPIAVNFAMGVDLAKNLEENAENPALAAVGTSADTLFSLPLLQVMSRIFGAGAGSSGGSDVVENISKAAAGSMTQFAPFGSTVNQIQKGLDDYKRENDDPDVLFKYGVNPMKHRLLSPESSGFMRDTLPVKVNTWGEKIKEEPWYNIWASPGKIQELEPEAVDLEIQRIFDDSGFTNQFPRYINFNIRRTRKGVTQEYSMTAEERVQYQMAFGQLAKGAVQEFMGTSEYWQLSDKDRALKISKIYTEAENIVKDAYLQGSE